jgi:SH3-like domain-containing protein
MPPLAECVVCGETEPTKIAVDLEWSERRDRDGHTTWICRRCVGGQQCADRYPTHTFTE